MGELTFISGDIPPDVESSSNAESPNVTDPTVDFSCEVCGVPIQYGGRGRKPRFCDDHRKNTRTSTSASTSAVDTALARMEMAYSIVATGLMMVSPVAAVDFAGRIEATQKLNRIAFEANPALTKRIGATSKQAGTLTFAFGNLMLVGPALRILYDTAALAVKSKKETADVNVFGDAFTSPTTAMSGSNYTGMGGLG